MASSSVDAPDQIDESGADAPQLQKPTLPKKPMKPDLRGRAAERGARLSPRDLAGGSVTQSTRANGCASSLSTFFIFVCRLFSVYFLDPRAGGGASPVGEGVRVAHGPRAAGAAVHVG